MVGQQQCRDRLASGWRNSSPSPDLRRCAATTTSGAHRHFSPTPSLFSAVNVPATAGFTPIPILLATAVLLHPADSLLPTPILYSTPILPPTCINSRVAPLSTGANLSGSPGSRIQRPPCRIKLSPNREFWPRCQADSGAFKRIGLSNSGRRHLWS